MRNKLLTSIIFILSFSNVMAASSGYMVRDTQVRLTPNNDAKTVFDLKTGNSINILSRQGGWYKIKNVKEKVGWVRMTSLRLGSARKEKGDRGLLSTFKFFSKGKSGKVVASTGVRGLDADDFANATPDHKAVEGLSKFSVSNRVATNFAISGKLKAVSIEFTQIVGDSK